jgi:hypothetical protein
LSKLNTIISKQKLFEDKFEEKLGELKEAMSKNDNKKELDVAFATVRLE